MRLFVGLELPWELRQRVAMLAGGGIPGARWVPPENYHVTLRFIGEAPRYMAEEIDHSLASLKVQRLPGRCDAWMPYNSVRGSAIEAISTYCSRRCCVIVGSLCLCKRARVWC